MAPDGQKVAAALRAVAAAGRAGAAAIEVLRTAAEGARDGHR